MTTGRLTRAFRAWLAPQDTQPLLSLASAEISLSTVAATALLLVLVECVPGLRELFHLRPALPLVGLAVQICGNAAFTLALRRAGAVTPRGLVLAVVRASAPVFFFGCMVAASTLPGATVFAAFILFLMTYHGHLHRVTPAQPLLSVGQAGAVGAALLVSPDGGHRALLALTGAAGVATQLVVGSLAARQERLRKETERLRAALDAQILAERASEVHRLEKTLVDVMATNHELNNTVMAARLAADTLVTMFAQEGARRPQEARELALEIAESLDHVQAMVDALRRYGQGSQPGAARSDSVAVGPVLQAAADETGRRFPRTRVEVSVRGPPSLAVRMLGGRATFERVVEDLVTNACEGSSGRGAQRVEVRAARDDSGSLVRLEVRDDGPGFPAEMLGPGAAGVQSSKALGRGLGLYTVEKLVRASGGTLTRANGPAGGAIVTITLPVGEMAESARVG